MPSRPRRLSPATVLATVALAVALGGSATAARTLIKGRDIAPGAIQARHIAAGAVTLPKIAPAARRALRGPAGPQGTPGPQGPSGGFDLSKLTRIVGPEISVAPGAMGTAYATCPAGHKVTGGGFGMAGFDETIFASAPSVDGTTWVVMVDNLNATFTTLTGSAYALCVAP